MNIKPASNQNPVANQKPVANSGQAGQAGQASYTPTPVTRDVLESNLAWAKKAGNARLAAFWESYLRIYDLNNSVHGL
jgi:hypothetical protein